MSSVAPAALLTLALASACASVATDGRAAHPALRVADESPALLAGPQDQAAQVETEQASDPPASADLAGWDRLPPQRFEELALAALPGPAPTPLDHFQLAELEGALERPGPRAVRAAVLLGRSRTRAAGEALLRRLERRVPAPARNGDAADVVAAGALERDPRSGWAAGRLAALGHGAGAHPDLEVRVACAAAALAHGRDEVVPFLLQVLRIGTPDGADDRRDFAISDTTTWARSEAALALSRRAGVPARYPEDGPFAARDRAAAALERVLRERGALVDGD